MRILLIDDEVEFLTPLTKRLKRRGIDVSVAGSGEQALEWLAGHDMDVAVLDMKMPGMDGIETLQEIKRLHPDVEVIMLTGHASVEAAIKGMELGAFDYMMKPVELDELVFKLEDAMQRKKLHAPGGAEHETNTAG